MGSDDGICPGCNTPAGFGAKCCATCGAELTIDATRQQDLTTEYTAQDSAEPDNDPVIRKCRRCGLETSNSAFKCVECGGALGPAGPTGSPAEAPKDWANRTFEGGWTGCLIFIVGLALIVWLLSLAMCSTSTPPAAQSQQQKTTDQATEGPNEIEIVTECDLTVKGSLASESSYDPESSWNYTLSGGQAEVLRRFEATNGFGAKLSSAYDCKFDVARKRITFLQTVSPSGTTTLIGSSASAHKRKHSHG
jgi:hypothetical protein